MFELTKEEKRTQKEAVEYVKNNKEELIEKFVLEKNPLPIDLLTCFMAGSPGAGKTEFSKRYVDIFLRATLSKTRSDKKINKLLSQRNVNLDQRGRLFVRIDVDEIREFLPQYKKADIKGKIKGNAHIVQRAAGKGLEFLRKYCMENSISFLHDGTFGSQYSTMQKIIKKSLKLGRKVLIIYIYTNPITAWDFTQKREVVEGRNVKKENFIDQFFKSMENVDRAKKEFGERVLLHCVLKDENLNDKKVEFNQPSVAKFLKKWQNKGVIKTEYDKSDLEKEL